jgi:hypothetical protein
MSEYKLHEIPDNLKPTKIEQLAVLSEMFKFTTLFVFAIVLLPFTHIIMPGEGLLGFILRCAFTWITFILVQNYMNNVRKAYFDRIAVHMNQVAQELIDGLALQAEPEEDTPEE